MGRVIKAKAGDGRVLPAVVVDARQQARAILDEARTRAQAMAAQVRSDARQAARAELAAEHLMLSAMRAAQTQAWTAQLTSLSLTVAKRLLHAELAMDPARIQSIVTPLLQQVRNAARIRLIVHDDDEDAVHAWLDPWIPPAADVTIEGDPRMERGGCIVETDVGILDARIETRLDALQRAFHNETHASR